MDGENPMPRGFKMLLLLSLFATGLAAQSIIPQISRFIQKNQRLVLLLMIF